MRLYYTPPSEASFQDMKRVAIETWNEVATNPDYAKEKADHIEKLQNVGDNFMTIFAYFDVNNQRICGAKLQQQTKDDLNARLRDGNSFESIIE